MDLFHLLLGVTSTICFEFPQAYCSIITTYPQGCGLDGSVSGTNISGSITGLGDSSYTVAALLKGGPALSVAQFESYKPTTIVGASLTITAPTGLYNPNKRSTLVQIAGRSTRNLLSRTPSALSRNGRSMPTPTPPFTLTTPLIKERKSSGNNCSPDSKDTLAIPSPTGSGPLLIRAIPSVAIPSSTA